MAQERVAYINGEILPESEVKIPFRDRGFMAGDTVFDTTRTFDKKIFKLHATEVIHIGTIGGTGAFKGVAVVKNNLRNVPKNVGSQAYFSTAGPRIELHYFESPIEEGQRSPWRSN